MSLKRIRLTLARDPEAPVGNDHCGYQFIAPIREDGHIDVEGWRKHKADCSVRRFWEGEDDEHGHLIHTQGRTWAFHYDVGAEDADDEPGYKFDSHVFKPGEYVSIREHDGRLRTFKVAAVEAWSARRRS